MRCKGCLCKEGALHRRLCPVLWYARASGKHHLQWVCGCGYMGDTPMCRKCGHIPRYLYGDNIGDQDLCVMMGGRLTQHERNVLETGLDEMSPHYGGTAGNKAAPRIARMLGRML